MLNEYFDQVYVINLDSRPDRLKSAFEEFKKIGASFVKIAAVDGYKEDLEVPDFPGADPAYWNPGAAGLVLTTIKLLTHAKKMGYHRILICEDDVEFDKDFNKKLVNLEEVPSDWQMILFGAQHMAKPKRITENISRVKAAFCLHCYAVKSEFFDYYLHLLTERAKQLDLVTLEDIQPLNKTYCFMPNIAFQKAGFSDIQKQTVDYSFLRSKNRIW
jgi:GR25 family glycosyltransferase involved in LPS biosynthesis